MEKVTAIIPAWNRYRDLKNCLEGLKRQDYPELEIMVIDNGSTDETRAFLKSREDLKVVFNDQNLGACLARNQGIIRASGSLVWFLDSDVEILDHDLLTQMVNYYLKNPEVGALGGEALMEGGQRRGFLCCKITQNGDTRREWIRSREATPMICDYIPTSNCLVSKSLLEQIGGFNPAYGYLAEDKELGFRIQSLGYKNLTGLNFTLWHKESPVSRIGRFVRYHRNRLLFVLLNFPLKGVLKLPWYDLLFFLQPDNIKKALERGSHGYLTKGNIFARSKWLLMLRWGWIMAWSFIYAYLWNLIHLKKTLRLRGRRNHFLRDDPC